MSMTDAVWFLPAKNNIEAKSQESDREAQHKDDAHQRNFLTPCLLNLLCLFA